MRKLLLVAGCGLMMCQTDALAQNQDKCGAQRFKELMIQRDPSAASAFSLHDQELIAKTAAYVDAKQHIQQKTTNVVTIPVVFHIVLSAAKITQLNGTAGIEARVLSQLEVINADMNAANADSTQIPSAFKPLFANAELQFALAHTDPLGHSTPGFEIITASTESFNINSGTFASDAKHAANGGANSWDMNRYLNIWVVNLDDNGASTSILGFSFAPSYIQFGVPADEIGVLLNYGAFGKRTSPFQYFISGIDKGRTLTHELGHFFELAHIWGDDNGMCPGSGGFDDGIGDTPPQADMNYNNPVFPKFDACVTSGNGVMFMNYMDYSNDASLQMFTTGQVSRMQASISPSGDGYSLTQHPEVLQWPLAVSNLEKETGVSISPNPAQGPVTISFSNPEGLQSINVLNMTGQSVYQINTNDQPIGNYNVDMSRFTKGLYLIQCNFASGTVTRKIVVQ
jgi:hypothetical protein